MHLDQHALEPETSSPLPVHEALNLLILHQIRGHAPYMEEEKEGAYIVHRGEKIEKH